MTLDERETGKKMPESNVHENMEAGDRRSETVIAKKETPDLHNVVPVNPEPLDNDIDIAEHEMENVVKARENSEENRPKKSILENQLTRSVADDGRRDTAFFQKCLGCYKAKDWSGTIEKLNHLIKTYQINLVK